MSYMINDVRKKRCKKNEEMYFSSSLKKIEISF